VKNTLMRKANDFAQCFERHTERRWRTERLSFWTLRPESPTELRDLVAAAQADYFRDAWRYDFIVQALNVIAVVDHPDEVELANTISNLGLLEWFASTPSRAAYVDKAVQEYGLPAGGIMDAILLGQAKEEEEVYQIVLDELRELIGEPSQTLMTQ
jgi:hypothetical protein